MAKNVRYWEIVERQNNDAYMGVVGLSSRVSADSVDTMVPRDLLNASLGTVCAVLLEIATFNQSKVREVNAAAYQAWVSAYGTRGDQNSNAAAPPPSPPSPAPEAVTRDGTGPAAAAGGPTPSVGASTVDENSAACSVDGAGDAVVVHPDLLDAEGTRGAQLLTRQRRRRRRRHMTSKLRPETALSLPLWAG